MYFPVAIFTGPGESCGATLPDIDGVNTAGDTLEQALANIQEAVELRLDALGVFGARRQA